MLKRAIEPLSIADMADGLGVHPNTVRFHVDSLVAVGRVECVSARQRVPGRPPKLFQVVAGMDPAGPRNYRVLAEILAGAFDADPERPRRAVEAGRRWGRRLGDANRTEVGTGADPVDRLVMLLGDVGFAPERATDQEHPVRSARRIDLRHRPFLEIAMDSPEVACPIHLGLMQGAMEAWKSPITVDRLDAFVDPDRCIAHLATIK
ncbi:helix-turn-helix transcriptional regulator [Amycolatopsis echigonensis]|nr:transcriptional regulator [Amycolatopsis niigatensis]